MDCMLLLDQLKLNFDFSRQEGDMTFIHSMTLMTSDANTHQITSEFVYFVVIIMFARWRYEI